MRHRRAQGELWVGRQASKELLSPSRGLPPAKGDQRNQGLAPGKGAVAPKTGEATTQGAPAGRKPRHPSSPRGLDEDEIQVVKVQQGGLTLPARVKERQYDWDDQQREAVPLLAGEGGWSSRS